MKKHLFDLEPDVHYLNCAYMSPLTFDVRDVGMKSVAQKCRPYEVEVDDFFKPVDDVRVLFSKLIQGQDKDRIAIIPSVSYGMANVAHNITLQKGEQIVIVGDQFPSNVYPWMELVNRDGGQLVIVEKPGSLNPSEDWSQLVIEAINEKTKIVALPHAHWADGTLFNLEEIGHKCRGSDALLIVDGTQSIGALEFDQQKVMADAVVTAGYKWLMGPYGIGAAYYGPWFDDKRPVEHNWINRLNSDDFKGLVQYESRLRPKGLKFSVGEQSNFILIEMFRKSLENVLSWGTDLIQRHCLTISQEALSALREQGFKIAGESQTGHHLFGIGLSPEIDFDQLKKALSERKVYVSFRGNQIRVAPHLYNTKTDFDVLQEVLMSL
jgi:selenocysteine lyase/cysteine desulfurase